MHLPLYNQHKHQRNKEDQPMHLPLYSLHRLLHDVLCVHQPPGLLDHLQYQHLQTLQPRVSALSPLVDNVTVPWIAVKMSAIVM